MRNVCIVLVSLSMAALVIGSIGCGTRHLQLTPSPVSTPTLTPVPSVTTGPPTPVEFKIRAEPGNQRMPSVYGDVVVFWGGEAGGELAVYSYSIIRAERVAPF